MIYTDTYNRPKKPIYTMVALFDRHNQTVLLVEKERQRDDDPLEWTLPGGWYNGKGPGYLAAGRHVIEQVGYKIGIYTTERSIETNSCILRGYVAVKPDNAGPVREETHIWTHYSGIQKMGLAMDPNARALLDVMKNDLFAAFWYKPPWQPKDQPNPRQP